MRRCRLRWHGDVERNDDADYVKALLGCCEGEVTCRQTEKELGVHSVC